MKALAGPHSSPESDWWNSKQGFVGEKSLEIMPPEARECYQAPRKDHLRRTRRSTL